MKKKYESRQQDSCKISHKAKTAMNKHIIKIHHHHCCLCNNCLKSAQQPVTYCMTDIHCQTERREFSKVHCIPPAKMQTKQSHSYAHKPVLDNYTDKSFTAYVCCHVCARVYTHTHTHAHRPMHSILVLNNLSPVYSYQHNPASKFSPCVDIHATTMTAVSEE